MNIKKDKTLVSDWYIQHQKVFKSIYNPIINITYWSVNYDILKEDFIRDRYVNRFSISASFNEYEY